MIHYELQAGSPFPRGPRWTTNGLNLAVYSAEAEALELCIYENEAATTPEWRALIPWRTHGVFHCEILGLRPGRCYGLRAHGAYDPAHGLRFNAAKLLLDPYARAVARYDVIDDALFGYRRFHADGDLHRDDRDSGAIAPLGVLIDDQFDWQGMQPPQVPWGDTIIYEAHVSGLTIQHPALPPEQRGCYAGLGHPAMIEYFKSLSITAVELLPVHQHFTEPFLSWRKRRNYWGYSTLGFFAPDRRFARNGSSAQEAVIEFKTMVRNLHKAGIEVILDVVYNHSCEGDQLGPTLSLRGLDNRSYYHLRHDTPRFYADHTGCGNALRMSSPPMLQLCMDSLRYWAREMQIDGFRFDLATTMLRGDHGEASPFLQTLAQDPELSRCKMIAEPWDLGRDGHRTGRFPAPWSEWNDSYRDGVRRFWRRDRQSLGGFVTRLAGSSDLFESGQRRPHASVNFICAHDGFTLADLVSYNSKHNEANGEENRDGTEHNLSWNCGVEGPSDDAHILERRRRSLRGLIASLAFSLGAPMLAAGDERGRSQQGNNNAYCQDNEISFLDWDPAACDSELLQWTRRCFKLRRRLQLYRADAFLPPEPDSASSHWISLRGDPLSEREWKMPQLFAFGALFPATQNDPELLLLFNAARRRAPFRLPGDRQWLVCLDSAAPSNGATAPAADGFYRLAGYSVAALLAGESAAAIIQEVKSAGT
ncbi:MAG: glycogen debranching protein GlgX [Leptospirales bacterium]|nr:glycogen debranching protein GlgX [Leptospirales bacterium]